MNLKTAAARLSVHYQTAYKLVRSGSLAAVKIGGTYEVSEAAIERYRAEREALRAMAAVPREDASAPVPGNRHQALAEVHAVASSTTTSAQAAFDTVARVGAETIGDTGVVVVATPQGFRPVASHDADPRRRAALAAMVDAFGADGPDGCLGRVAATQRPLLLPHVAQDRLRLSVDPQHRQFLDVIGVHSLAIAPIVNDEGLEAAVVLSRATPGAPYGLEELAFVESLASSLGLALGRASVYRAGWRRRREMVQRIERGLRESSTPAIDWSLGDDGFAEIVSDLNGNVMANAATEQLTDGDISRLLNSEADRLRAGDLEFYDDERDMPGPNGATMHLVVHRGLVRDDAAQPQAMVLVAQQVRALA